MCKQNSHISSSVIHIYQTKADSNYVPFHGIEALLYIVIFVCAMCMLAMCFFFPLCVHYFRRCWICFCVVFFFCYCISVILKLFVFVVCVLSILLLLLPFCHWRNCQWLILSNIIQFLCVCIIIVISALSNWLFLWFAPLLSLDRSHTSSLSILCNAIVYLYLYVCVCVFMCIYLFTPYRFLLLLRFCFIHIWWFFVFRCTCTLFFSILLILF